MNRWVFLGSLLAAVALWGTGKFVQESHKKIYKRRAVTVGAAKWFEWGRGLWRRRAGVVSTAAWLTIAVFLAAVAVAWQRSPQQRQGITLVGVLGVLGGWAAWDAWRFPDGQRYRQVAVDLRRKRRIREQVAATGASPLAVTISDGGAEVLVDHTSDVDHETVGRSLRAGHTELVPTAEMGRSRILVHDQAPPPVVGEWDAIRARGVLLLPRPLPGGSAAPRLGEDRYGRVHTLHPVVDPSNGCNTLLAGVTGSGKSVVMTSLMCELAWQQDVAWVGLDPHRVELKRFESRMFHLASGSEHCVATLDWLLTVMDERMAQLDETGVDEWRIGVDGPGILWWLDEVAALPQAQVKTTLRRLLQEQRKFGMGCVLATQRPSEKVIELEVRDNCRTRIACGMESTEGSKMILGARPDGAFDPTEIPEDLSGGYVLRLNRSRLAGRAYLPSAGGTSKADIADFSRRVAAATAHLNVPIA